MQSSPQAGNNFWLKLFSVVLASLIWFVVDSDLKDSRSIDSPIFRDSREFTVTNIPVAVLTSPGDVRGFTIDPPSVEVALKAGADGAVDFSPSAIRVFVDLSGGKEPAPLESLHITAPPGLTPLRATPPVAKLTETKH